MPRGEAKLKMAVLSPSKMRKAKQTLEMLSSVVAVDGSEDGGVSMILGSRCSEDASSSTCSSIPNVDGRLGKVKSEPQRSKKVCQL